MQHRPSTRNPLHFNELGAGADGHAAAATTGNTTQAQVYAAPMASIVGTGAIAFQVTLGMLVNANLEPTGLYRGYPSPSRVPLSEQYTLDMLTTKDDAILASYHDIPLLVLHGRVAPRRGDYPLVLTYLAHLTPRRYARCTVRVRYRNGVWELTNAHGKVATRVAVESNLSGIQSVSVCQVPAKPAP